MVDKVNMSKGSGLGGADGKQGRERRNNRIAAA